MSALDDSRGYGETPPNLPGSEICGFPSPNNLRKTGFFCSESSIFLTQPYTQTWQINAGSLSLPVIVPMLQLTNFTSYCGCASSHSLMP